MFCPNQACEKHGVDVANDRFCDACGTKCTEAPPPKVKEAERPQTVEMTSGGASVKNIVSGDQHNTTTVMGGAAMRPANAFAISGREVGATKNIIGGNQHISNTTVVNQDETKAVRVCAVSGRQARVIEGYTCPSCSNWVHIDYFDRETMTCSSCRQKRTGSALDIFQSKVREVLGDGILSREEIGELKRLGAELGISEELQSKILEEARTAKKPADKPITMLDRTKLKTAIRQLCQRGSAESQLSALKTLKVLHKAYPADLQIASLLVMSGTLSCGRDNIMEIMALVEGALRDSAAFSYDSPRKYLLKAGFYRAFGLLLGAGGLTFGNDPEATAQVAEASSYGYQKEASQLENLFPESPEAHAIQLVALLDHFYETGELQEVKQEITEVLGSNSSGDGMSPVSNACAILSEKWSSFGSAVPIKEELSPESVEAHLLYELLFGLSLQSLQKKEQQEREALFAQLGVEPQGGANIAIRVPGSPVSLHFCACPPGSYMMGRAPDEPGSTDEGVDVDTLEEDARLPVTFKHGFWMGKTTVTYEQWKAVMGEHEESLDQYREADFPINRVSSNDANAFCQKLNQMRLLPPGWIFSLPSEAVWEYACRAGSTGLYAGPSLDLLAWFSGNSGDELHKVAQKQPNAWGLYDMHGNVWEHCRDWYDPMNSCLNPDVNLQGKKPGAQKIIRGGSKASSAEDCRSAKRDNLDDGAKFDDVGFRICVQPEHQFYFTTHLPHTDQDSRSQGFQVAVDSQARPNCMASGTVRFSDGVSTHWSLDNTGRMNLGQLQQGFSPSAADLKAFQEALQSKLGI